MADIKRNPYRYNAKQISISVNSIPVTGFAEEMWSFTKEQALGEVTEGAQGDAVYNATNSNLYKAVVTLQQSSPDVDRLFDLANAAEAFPVWMTDAGLGIQEGGTNALLAEIPEDTRGKSLGDIAFTFFVFDGERKKI